MANSVPTLTNENFHMFEPSPIETSLVANVDNPATPSARGNLFRYQTQNQLQGQNYQDQVNQMHAAQIAEAMMAQRTSRMTAAGTLLKDAGQTPGMVDALQRIGLVDPGIDLSPIGNAANAAANSKNMGEAGRGIGAAATGGITGLAPAAQSVFGPGVQQGDPALVQAARINAAGRVAASGNNAGMATVSAPQGPIGPNQPTVRFHVPIKQITGLPFVGGGSSATAPVDDGSDGVAGNPLLGGIPGVSPQLADQGAAARPAGSMPAQPTVTKTRQQVQQSVAAALPNIAANNPAVHADIIAGAVNGVPNVIANPHGPGYIIQGAKGQYNAQGF